MVNLLSKSFINLKNTLLSEKLDLELYSYLITVKNVSEVKILLFSRVLVHTYTPWLVKNLKQKLSIGGNALQIYARSWVILKIAKN